jgi:hypothetical protein
MYAIEPLEPFLDLRRLEMKHVGENLRIEFLTLNSGCGQYL